MQIWELRFPLVWPQRYDQSVSLLICPSESSPLGPWLLVRSPLLMLGQRGQVVRPVLCWLLSGGSLVMHME